MVPLVSNWPSAISVKVPDGPKYAILGTIFRLRLHRVCGNQTGVDEIAVGGGRVVDLYP
jgi:hypothetical protein